MRAKSFFYVCAGAALLVVAPEPVTPSQSCACQEVSGRLVDVRVEGDVTVGQD
jgi:hypothetical protein